MSRLESRHPSTVEVLAPQRELYEISTLIGQDWPLPVSPANVPGAIVEGDAKNGVARCVNPRAPESSRGWFKIIQRA
jgi:hypothetical protein